MTGWNIDWLTNDTVSLVFYYIITEGSFSWGIKLKLLFDLLPYSLRHFVHTYKNTPDHGFLIYHKSEMYKPIFIFFLQIEKKKPCEHVYSLLNVLFPLYCTLILVFGSCKNVYWPCDICSFYSTWCSSMSVEWYFTWIKWYMDHVTCPWNHFDLSGSRSKSSRWLYERLRTSFAVVIDILLRFQLLKPTEKDWFS